MPDSPYNVDLRDIRFVLYEHLRFDTLNKLERFAAVDRESVDMVLDETLKFQRDVIAPLNGPGDQQGCRYDEGKVTLPDGFVEAYRRVVESGWLKLAVSEDLGGMGMPNVVEMAAGESTVGACCSMSLSVGLSHAAGMVIERRGSERLRELYLDRLYSGDWQGTMCLTEPQAGSAVGDSRTMAKKVEGADHYLIEGTKIFITAGDHDACENHVHLVLARTEGAPAGAKGLSLFVVPKFRPDDQGEKGEFNDVVCGGIEHKMGIKGSPTCTLNFGEAGDCRGWMIGDEGEGLTHMFMMMNHARLGVGLQGVALAAQAYNYAAEYARERVQGTDIEQMKDPHAPRVTINQHPNVRRMLLWCKAMVEGCRAMLYRTALYHDVANASADAKEAGISRDLVDLLTPVCKAYISDMGFEVTRLAMQVLGGYGYVAEYPVEQHMRDIKIASIYEGTNGIQALDLLGRKLPKQQGRLFRNLVKAVERFTGGQKEHLVLGKAVGFFTEEVERLKKLTMDLAMIGMGGDRRYPVLHATPYLEMIGNVTCAWLLLEQAVVAHDKLQALYLDRGAEDPEARAKLHQDDAEARFYFNKIETARFFVFNILPRNQAIAAQFDSKDRSALEFIP